MKKLTLSDLKTLSRALNDAQSDRDSLAEAYGRAGPEAEHAKKQVKAYEALHVKIFGGPSARALQIAEDAATPSVSIFDLQRRTEYDL